MEGFPLNGQRIKNMIDLSMSPKEIKTYIKENIEVCIGKKAEIITILREDKRKTVKDLEAYLIKEEEKFKIKLAHGKAMYDFDKDFSNLVAGVDEVGRGPLAGPIVGACVLIDYNEPWDKFKEILLDIDDSKKLSHDVRAKLVPEIKKRVKSWAIYMASNKNIDEMGISYCNNAIFLKAIEEVGKKAQIEIVLSDGYYVKGCSYKNERVIKGDSKSLAIACASIIAKEFRDDLMKKIHGEFPQYGFLSNVGYGSKEHRDAILKYGVCPYHRMSFLKEILKGHNLNKDEYKESDNESK